MKKQLGLLLAIMTVAALTGCSKDVEVTGDLSGLSIPGGSAQTTQAGVASRAFEGGSGRIQFVDAGAGKVQVLRQDASGTTLEYFEVVLNSNVPYTTTTDGQKRDTYATGSLDHLTLTTQISVNDQLYATAESNYSLSDDPCQRGGGSGLQNEYAYTHYVQGGSEKTEYCIAYH